MLITNWPNVENHLGAVPSIRSATLSSGSKTAVTDRRYRHAHWTDGNGRNSESSCSRLIGVRGWRSIAFGGPGQLVPHNLGLKDAISLGLLACDFTREGR